MCRHVGISIVYHGLPYLFLKTGGRVGAFGNFDQRERLSALVTHNHNAADLGVCADRPLNRPRVDIGGGGEGEGIISTTHEFKNKRRLFRVRVWGE